MFNEDMLNKLSKDDLIKLVMDLQRDALTGVYKREVMSNIVKKEYVVAMVDVNGLKTINDNMGHDAGDEYIISVVNDIKKCIRPSDYIVRYGGDEFIVVFDSCTTDNARKAISRVSNASTGVGVGDTLEEAIKKADINMYLDKSAYYSNS